MQAPPLLEEMVVFLAYKTASGDMREAGTAFMLAMPLPGLEQSTEERAIYLITARHVIEAINKKGCDGYVYTRVNHRERGAEYVKGNVSSWIKHPNRNIDAAVQPISFGYGAYKHGSNPIGNKLTRELIDTEQIGPGDDLFFPGLFVHHKGEKENIPIVRTGTIAAMPGEPIQTDTQGPMRAYLIEARSLGGLSGSPVFLHLCGPRAARAQSSIGGGGAWNAFFLLGMVQGHYGVSDVLDSSEDDSPFDMRSRSINLGIAIVVPFEDIEEILNIPHFVKQREKRAANYLAKESSPPAGDE